MHITPGMYVSVGLSGEDEYYSFESRVLAVREGEISTFVIEKPAVINRIQRRKYMRVTIHMKVGLKVQGTVPIIIDALSNDISIGGLKISAEANIEEGREISITIPDNSELQSFTCGGRVARVNRVKPDKWEYGVQFTKLSEGARKNIMDVVESAGLS